MTPNIQQIMVRGTTYHLGFFTEPTDAAHAYDTAGMYMWDWIGVIDHYIDC